MALEAEQELALAGIFAQNEVQDIMLTHTAFLFEELGETGDKALEAVLDHMLGAASVELLSNEGPLLALSDDCVDQGDVFVLRPGAPTMRLRSYLVFEGSK
jgi:hypothetical protein